MSNMECEIKYIGKKITYLILKNTILDEKLREHDTIYLNAINYKEIMEEYVAVYKQEMPFPHLLLGVLIKEAIQFSIPENRIGVLKNDYVSVREVSVNYFKNYDGEVFYRCKTCGKVITKFGKPVTGYDLERSLIHIQNNKKALVRRIDGDCCENLNTV